MLAISYMSFLMNYLYLKQKDRKNLVVILLVAFVFDFQH